VNKTVMAKCRKSVSKKMCKSLEKACLYKQL
jgi:hypothetical protein